MIEINCMPHGEVVMYNGVLWMTKRTFENLKKVIAEREDKE